MFFYITSRLGDGLSRRSVPFSALRDTMMFILGLMNGKRDGLDALWPLYDLHRAWEKRRHADPLGTLFLFILFYFLPYPTKRNSGIPIPGTMIAVRSIMYPSFGNKPAQPRRSKCCVV